MTEQKLRALEKQAETLEKESIDLHILGRRAEAAEKAESAYYLMETLAKSEQTAEYYTTLVSYCWNYLTTVKTRDHHQDPFFQEVARTEIQAQEYLYSGSKTVSDKASLAAVYRDVSEFLGYEAEKTARNAVALAKEVVRDRGQESDLRLLASCYTRLSRILHFFGSYEKSLESVEQAISLLEGLPSRTPWDDTYRIEARNMHAILMSRFGYPERAKADLDENSDALQKALQTAKEPNQQVPLFLMAAFLVRNFRHTRFAPYAEHVLVDTIAEVEANTESLAYAVYRDSLLYFWSVYAEYLFEHGRYEEAIVYGNDAMSFNERLISFPYETDILTDRNRAVRAIARSYAALGNRKAAAEWESRLLPVPSATPLSVI